MQKDKPNYPEGYISWLHDALSIEITDHTKTYYETVTRALQQGVEESNFWLQLGQNLRIFDADYFLKTGYNLLMPGFEPKLLQKPFSSTLNKSYRKNVLQNKQWPQEPRDGWIVPGNWYSRINDIIRTSLVVRYLDGVEFMLSSLESLCKTSNMTCKSFLEARQEGYYAAHFYTNHQVEIPSPLWDTERVQISIEIQVTTQLQEVIKNLLHKYYEEHRSTPSEDSKWQWNYRSDEFSMNYLGHILHYVEGMIMEIREKQQKGAIK